MKIFYLTPLSMALFHERSALRFYRNSGEYLLRLDDEDNAYFQRIKESRLTILRRCLVKVRKSSLPA